MSLRSSDCFILNKIRNPTGSFTPPRFTSFRNRKCSPAYGSGVPTKPKVDHVTLTNDMARHSVQNGYWGILNEIR
ncbi:hypothetical protein BELL_0030g00020 [Botrytis elliptica]|uniref:Uncharacterized protein n=1 Tax=Botrytis elliptica TaxID=278938 RepID=A0A4Z1K012_9HELO|nr:hypothetical protein BELL_0030g00020 [Botrytis elliptica]